MPFPDMLKLLTSIPRWNPAFRLRRTQPLTPASDEGLMACITFVTSSHESHVYTKHHVHVSYACLGVWKVRYLGMGVGKSMRSTLVLDIIIDLGQ